MILNKNDIIKLNKTVFHILWSQSNEIVWNQVSEDIYTQLWNQLYIQVLDNVLDQFEIINYDIITQFNN